MEHQWVLKISMLGTPKATDWLEAVLLVKAGSNLDFLLFEATRIAQCENVFSEIVDMRVSRFTGTSNYIY